MSVGQSVD